MMVHKNPAYFLISVSNKENLELCKRYALAGFTNSINGLWTFSELNIGDYISFLYAARAHNLYKVIGKEAIQNAETIGPWQSITFRMSGKTYYFPFRIQLEPIRAFEEPLVRNEFAYVAENLLLRGGYRKTHFQADQTTLQNVSQMGGLFKKKCEQFNEKVSMYSPGFTTKRNSVKNPITFLFQEIILQSLIRQHLSLLENMNKFLGLVGINDLKAENIEILGEKALPEGHIDLLIKESVPIGISKQLVVEVKLHTATLKDFEQINNYLELLGDECICGVLIANKFSKKITGKFPRIIPIVYSLSNFENITKSFNELLDGLCLKRMI
ncbi:MAG: hypothetical protein V1734_02355 [Nanoarchaeota archaeon]